jgi:hypothetical protein
MRAILSDIRALPGVTGIAVLSKRDGRIDHLFPAAVAARDRDVQAAAGVFAPLAAF